MIQIVPRHKILNSRQENSFAEISATGITQTALQASYRSCTLKPGGRDCFNLSAFSESNTQRVYRYLEQRTLNLTTSLLLLIFTERASFLLAVRRKSLISWICFGWQTITKFGAMRKCKQAHCSHNQKMNLQTVLSKTTMFNMQQEQSSLKPTSCCVVVVVNTQHPVPKQK